MMKDILTEKEALLKAEAFCSRVERCSGEMIRKLEQWGVSSGLAGQILQQLVDDGFVDDRRYAAAFVREKFRFNQWGRIKIARALRERGIAREVMELALRQIDESEYQSVLQELLRGKQRTVKGRSAFEVKQKLIRFALGRGFELETVLSCLPGSGALDLEMERYEIDE